METQQFACPKCGTLINGQQSPPSVILRGHCEQCGRNVSKINEKEA